MRRFPRLWLLALAIGVAGLAALLGAGLRHDPTAIRSPLVGRTAPAFDLPRMNGTGRVRLADLRGQVVVLTFWASWCAECRNEQVNLNAAWESYRDAGVVFVGVDFQDSEPDARAFLAETRTTWPVVTDTGSRTALAYGVYGVPETFVLSPSGQVVAKQLGEIRVPELSHQIDTLLAAGRSS